MMRKLPAKLDPCTFTHQLVIQCIEYFIGGGIYFWSGYTLFAALWTEFGWSLWWAKLVANIFGWPLNYLLQRYWVLKGHHTQVTGRYTLTTLGDFLLDYLIVAGFNLIGVTPYIGQFISASFFGIWNYAWYRFWVFPDRLANQKTIIAPTHLPAHWPHGHGAYVEGVVHGQ